LPVCTAEALLGNCLGWLSKIEYISAQEDAVATRNVFLGKIGSSSYLCHFHILELSMLCRVSGMFAGSILAQCLDLRNWISGVATHLFHSWRVVSLSIVRSHA
jgi:hypothetical protein